ncbi:MAG TPA: SMP-30/gluconolactonase/LRE family protein [Acidimicrobiales bacterium]|nr:SMP-30/gluconolactonase/LRE family protein [Acidimicrobiales bacterium]
MAETKLVAEGLRFPEGPIAMDDGSVVLVEIKGQCLTRVQPDGTTSVIAELGGGPNGAAVGPDGAVYVCNNGGFAWHEVMGMNVPGEQPEDYIGGRIQRVDLGSGEVTDLYTECNGIGLRGPNDIVFDRDGGFWFTDLGKSRERETDKGGIYYATADGSTITEVVYGMTTPNGIGLSPDGSRLYVAETQTGRVWWWDVAGPGQLQPGATMPFSPGQATLLHTFPNYQLLDSLAVDGDGNVCVATLLTGAITAISTAGEVVAQVPVPDWDPFVTNVCFGGPDGRTAFITSSGFGKLYAAEWPFPGLTLNHTA